MALAIHPLVRKVVFHRSSSIEITQRSAWSAQLIARWLKSSPWRKKLRRRFHVRLQGTMSAHLSRDGKVNQQTAQHFRPMIEDTSQKLDDLGIVREDADVSPE